MLYDQLHKKPRHIRLLTINPGVWETAVDCSLTVVHLDEHPVYECLSYTWGPPDARHKEPVTVNGYSVTVTPNLHAALKSLRQPFTPRVLWADAICINQESRLDRSSQVQLMHLIYSRSLRTVIWLGEESDSSNLAVDSILEFGRYAYYDSNDWQGLAVLRKKEIAEDFDMALRGDKQRLQYAAVCEMLRRPWFKRVWVVQETTLAHSVHVLCGRKSFRWNDLSNTLAFLAHCCGQIDTIADWFRDLVNLHKMDLWRIRQTGWSEAPFNALVHDFRDYHATDRKDKVYGLLGLASDPRVGAATIDYNFSISKVYNEATSNLILTGHGLNILHAVQGTYVDKELPSWVPDWSVPWASYLVTRDIYWKNQDMGLQNEDNLKKALRLRKAEIDQAITFDAERKELRAGGLIWTAVAKVFPKGYDLSNDQPEAAAKALEFWQKMLEVDLDNREKRKRSTEQGVALSMKWLRISMEFLSPDAIFNGRRWVLLKDGTYGLISEEAETDDTICFLGDQGVPFVLRNNISGSWQLVGQFVSEGVMNCQSQISLFESNTNGAYFTLI